MLRRIVCVLRVFECEKGTNPRPLSINVTNPGMGNEKKKIIRETIFMEVSVVQFNTITTKRLILGTL